MSMLEGWRYLIPYIVASNVLFLILPIGFHYLLPTYSFENALLLDHSSPLYFSVSFDGSHFLTNDYSYQKNFAFLPGFTTIVRTLLLLFQSETSITIILIINKVCFSLSSIVLMNLVKLVTRNRQTSRFAAILFLFNPASIFYHAVYSESIYSLIVFSGIYQVIDTNQLYGGEIDTPVKYIKNNIAGLLLLGLSTIFRATGVFTSLILGVPIISKLIRQISNRRFAEAIQLVITGTLVLSFFTVFFVKYLYDGYTQFCFTDGNLPEFCQSRVPNIYSYIQERFWQVGFLVYYQPDKLVPMLFGLPSMMCALVTFSPTKNVGLNLSYCLLLLVTILFSNVQSSARFFSSHPMYYIGLARFLTTRNRLGILQMLVWFYLVTYNVFGVVFFPQRFWWV